MLSDVRDCGAHNLPTVDLITLGSPCQDLSVAGKRKGLIDGKKSSLFFEAIRVVGELKPTFAVWENVPGAFSSNSGRDFATVLASFRDIGARDIAWTVLDAQYFGVAQRRRRMFLVADFRGERAAEILFESSRSAWDSPPSREAGQGTARDVTAGALHSGTPGRDASDVGNGHLIAPCLSAHHSPRYNPENEALIADPLMASPYADNESQHRKLIAFDYQVGGTQRTRIVRSGEYAQITRTHVDAITSQYGVRRLTPTECCRLQGFPDDWNDGQSDSARYRQLGNAVAVPCAHWLGRRILGAL